LGNSGFRANINFTLSLPRLRIYPDISLISAGASVDIYAVKLEIGSISTLAADPPQDYGVELTKCQRYYVPAYKEMDGFGTLAANGTDAYITFPVGIMRIMPTLGGGTATTSNWSIKLSDGSVRTPTDIFVQAITRTGVRLRFTIASAAGNITAIAFYNTNTDGGFDADL